MSAYAWSFGDGQDDGAARLLEQELPGRRAAPHGVAVHGEQEVALRDVLAGRGERRVLLLLPHVAGVDARDAVRTARGVALEVAAELSRRVAARERHVAAHRVRVRRAELALQLPEQVEELLARADAVHERQVPLEACAPVHLDQLFVVEVVALQRPRLLDDLAVLGARIGRE